MSAERSCNWVFTLKADSLTPEEVMERLNYDYVIFQKERGEENGFIHYQGYISHSSQIRFSTLKNIFPTIHLEVRKAPTHAEAIAYCSKEETRIDGPFIKGNTPKDRPRGSQGKLDSFVEDIKSGLEFDELIERYPGLMFRYEKAYESLRAKYLKKIWLEDRPKEVVYIFGLPGTGKTRYVMDHCQDESFYIAEKHRDGSFLFDDYTEEHTLILEEFRSNIEYSTLLQLLDRYPFKFPCRYQNRMSFVDKVYITSNLDLFDQYPTLQIGDSRQALYRRINELIYIDKDCIVHYRHDKEDPLAPFVESLVEKNPYFG